MISNEYLPFHAAPTGKRSSPALLLLLFSLITLPLLFASVAFAAIAIENVDAPQFFTNFYARAIAIDASNRPHIVYGGDNLYHSYHNGTSWQTEVIDSSPGVGQFASITIQSGNMHVSYYDSLNGDLKYATKPVSSGTWSIAMVDTGGTGNVGQYTAIAVDSSSNVHISYYAVTNADLKYARYNGSSWSTTAIDTTGTVGQYSSVAVDSAGNVHISYYDTTNADLKYAFYNGSAWGIATVDSTGNVGQYTSLAIDSSNNIHISYYAPTGANLKYAFYNGSSWSTASIDSTGTVGLQTSVSVDSGGSAHISYFDSTNGTLKYGTNAGGPWALAHIDVSSDVGQYSSIAVDFGNDIHISYYDTVTDDLKHAVRPLSGGAWTTSVVDSTGNVGQYTAIDSNNRVHISYYDATNGDLKYATNASGPWIITTLDATGTTGQYTSIAIDSNNRVHISYYQAGGATYNDLKYATNASGSWVTTTLDSSGTVGQFTSIAVDSNNRLHISYYDATNGDLKYATNVSGSWALSTVDNGGTGTVGQYSSIAIDANNDIHISYYATTGANLKYATKPVSGGSWTISTIDSTGTVGQFSSIATDTTSIHISYYDGTGGNLKYATKPLSGGSWTISTIDSTGTVGQFSSITTDAYGNIHISYYNASLYDCKHAIIDGSTPVTSASPAGGTYAFAQNVTLTASEPATTYYSTDGSYPSLVYSGPISIPATTTLRFFSADSGGNTEPVKTELYTISQTGSNVIVNLQYGIVLVFASISSYCTTSATLLAPMVAPSGYRFVGPQYNITTCATYTPPVTVTIPYNEADVQGPEYNLKMLHLENGTWKNVTISVDTVNNTITGSVNSLSPFGIGYVLGYSTGVNIHFMAFLALLSITAGILLLRMKLAIKNK